MLKCNGQMSLITAQRFYWPQATPDVLTCPAESEKRAEHRGEFREFVDGGQVQVRPRLPHDVPILDQLGLRQAAVVASAGNAATRALRDIGRRDAVTGHFPIEGHDIDT